MKKQKQVLKDIIVAPLLQIGAWRALHRTPAEVGCGGIAQTFRQTTLRAQEQGKRGSGGVPSRQGVADI